MCVVSNLSRLSEKFDLTTIPDFPKNKKCLKIKIKPIFLLPFFSADKYTTATSSYGGGRDSPAGESSGGGQPSSGSSAAGETFVVQRGRTVPTLASVSQQQRSASPAAVDKELLNTDTKSEERGEETYDDHDGVAGGGGTLRRGSVFDQMKNIPVAGRPSDTPRRGGRGSSASR